VGVRESSTAAARVGLVAAVVAIVLGILGMHALALHGSTSMGPVAGMSGMSGMSGQGAATVAATSDPAPASTADAPHHPGHDMGDMVMLCASMLVAAGFALMALLLRRVPTSSWTITRPRLAPTVRRPGRDRAGTGPPAVWAFSVIRC
jgi:hypothetical protein